MHNIHEQTWLSRSLQTHNAPADVHVLQSVCVWQSDGQDDVVMTTSSASSTSSIATQLQCSTGSPAASPAVIIIDDHHDKLATAPTRCSHCHRSVQILNTWTDLNRHYWTSDNRCGFKFGAKYLCRCTTQALWPVRNNSAETTLLFRLAQKA